MIGTALLVALFVILVISLAHAHRASVRFWDAQAAFMRAVDAAETVADVEALYPHGKALEGLSAGFRQHAAGVREASIAYRTKLNTLRKLETA